MNDFADPMIFFPAKNTKLGCQFVPQPAGTSNTLRRLQQRYFLKAGIIDNWRSL